jgi:hypothetical protein
VEHRARRLDVIELTEHQQKAVDSQEQPPIVVDPRTGQEYLLIRREVYELVRGTLKPFGRGWEDSADDDLLLVNVDPRWPTIEEENHGSGHSG